MRFFLYLVFFAMLLIASVLDIRSRRCPNILACCLCICALAVAYFGGGIKGCLSGLIGAFFTCALLVTFEALWRKRRGAAGIGMGDVKVLFALMTIDPFTGILSFALGLLALAMIGVALHRQTLPALPFISAAFCIVRYLL